MAEEKYEDTKAYWKNRAKKAELQVAALQRIDEDRSIFIAELQREVATRGTKTEALQAEFAELKLAYDDYLGQTVMHKDIWTTEMTKMVTKYEVMVDLYSELLGLVVVKEEKWPLK